MDEKQKDLITRRINIAGIVVLVLAIAYMLYAGLVLKKLGALYPVVICTAIFIFWLLQDVVKPILTKSLEGKTPQQVSNYKKCALLSLGGYAGLCWFALSINGGNGIYGAVVYLICRMAKRRIQEEESDEEEALREREAGETAPMIAADEQAAEVSRNAEEE